MRCPQKLSEEAKRYWQRNAPALIEAGVLNDTTVDDFTLLCQQWAYLQAASVEIEDHNQRSKERMWYNGLMKNYLALRREFKIPKKKQDIGKLIKEGLDAA